MLCKSVVTYPSFTVPFSDTQTCLHLISVWLCTLFWVCHLTRTNFSLLAYHLGLVEAHYEHKIWPYLISSEAGLRCFFSCSYRRSAAAQSAVSSQNGFVTVLMYTVHTAMSDLENVWKNNSAWCRKHASMLKLVLQSRAVSSCPVRRNIDWSSQNPIFTSKSNQVLKWRGGKKTFFSVLFFPEICEHLWRTSVLRGRAMPSPLAMKQGVLKTLLLVRCHSKLRCQYEDNLLKSWVLQMYTTVSCSDWILNLQTLLKFIVFSGVYQTTETEYYTTYIAAWKALLTEGSFFCGNHGF